jgi:hypothetical protein
MQREEQAFHNRAAFEKHNGDFCRLTLSSKGQICTAQSVRELATDLEGRGMKLVDASVNELERWVNGSMGYTYTGNILRAKTEAGNYILVRLFKPTESYDKRKVESLMAYDETGYEKSHNSRENWLQLDFAGGLKWRDYGNGRAAKPIHDEPAIWAAVAALGKTEQAKSGIQVAGITIDPQMYPNGEGRIHVLKCELGRNKDDPMHDEQNPPLYWKEGVNFDDAKAKSTVYIVISTSETCDPEAREIRNFMRNIGFRVAQFVGSAGPEAIPAHEVEAARAETAEQMVVAAQKRVADLETARNSAEEKLAAAAGALETAISELKTARGESGSLRERLRVAGDENIRQQQEFAEETSRLKQTNTDLEHDKSALSRTIGFLHGAIDIVVQNLTSGNTFGSRGSTIKGAVHDLGKARKHQ